MLGVSIAGGSEWGREFKNIKTMIKEAHSSESEREGERAWGEGREKTENANDYNRTRIIWVEWLQAAALIVIIGVRWEIGGNVKWISRYRKVEEANATRRRERRQVKTSEEGKKGEQMCVRVCKYF